MITTANVVIDLSKIRYEDFMQELKERLRLGHVKESHVLALLSEVKDKPMADFLIDMPF
jgi:hypothetical protein